jgi:HK97 family phage major capsid protein
MASLMPKDFAAWRATHPRIAGGENMTRQELADRQQAIRSRIVEINTEFADQRYPEDVRSEWNDLNDEFDRNEETLRELNARAERVATIARAATEDATDTAGGAERGAGFHTQSPNRGENVWDYSHVRGAVSIEGQKQMLRDQAMRAVERTSFYQPRSGGFERGEAAARPTVRDEDARAHVQWLLDTQDDEHGTVARRVLNTGNPLYQRAFGKAVFDKPTTAEEQRALGLTNTAGGYAVPFTLDPTIIPTSNYSVNPYRAIANVKQITGTTWQGVTSAGVVATRRVEGDEAADNSPTLAQPSVTPQRVDVFIPYSMEIGMDWAGMQGEMARLIADAKDDEEAASFTTGSGTPPAAQGIVTGATTTVTAGGTAAFSVADVYALEQALPPRFRARASFVGNRFVYNKVRQFDTQGGASLWVDNLTLGLQNGANGNVGSRILGYPAYEATSSAAALTTGSKILIFGDFGYFAIVDRIGMDVETIPMLFGANRRPTGQRGIFAVWRNNSAVLAAAAFRVLVTG